MRTQFFANGDSPCGLRVLNLGSNKIGDDGTVYLFNKLIADNARCSACLLGVLCQLLVARWLTDHTHSPLEELNMQINDQGDRVRVTLLSDASSVFDRAPRLSATRWPPTAGCAPSILGSLWQACGRHVSDGCQLDRVFRCGP